MKLEDAVARAVERLRVHGIQGWGLSVPQGLPGEVVVAGPATGCFDRTCNHVSHDPGAPTYRWVPPEGAALIRLEGSDSDNYTYYVLRHENKDIYLRLIWGQHYYDSLEVVAPTEVPEFALASLAQG